MLDLFTVFTQSGITLFTHEVSAVALACRSRTYGRPLCPPLLHHGGQGGREYQARSRQLFSSLSLSLSPEALCRGLGLVLASPRLARPPGRRSRPTRRQDPQRKIDGDPVNALVQTVFIEVCERRLAPPPRSLPLLASPRLASPRRRRPAHPAPRRMAGKGRCRRGLHRRPEVRRAVPARQRKRPDLCGACASASLWRSAALSLLALAPPRCAARDPPRHGPPACCAPLWPCFGRPGRRQAWPAQRPPCHVTSTQPPSPRLPPRRLPPAACPRRAPPCCSPAWPGLHAHPPRSTGTPAQAVYAELLKDELQYVKPLLKKTQAAFSRQFAGEACARQRCRGPRPVAARLTAPLRPPPPPLSRSRRQGAALRRLPVGL